MCAPGVLQTLRLLKHKVACLIAFCSFPFLFDLTPSCGFLRWKCHNKWRNKPPWPLLAVLLSEEFIHWILPFSAHICTYTQNRAAASTVWCRKCSISSSGDGCDIWPQGFNERLSVWMRSLAYVYVCADMKGLGHLLNRNRSVTTSSALKDCFITGTSPDCENGSVCVCVCKRACRHISVSMSI